MKRSKNQFVKLILIILTQPTSTGTGKGPEKNSAYVAWSSDDKDERQERDAEKEEETAEMRQKGQEDHYRVASRHAV